MALATSIAEDVRALSDDAREAVLAATPVPIRLRLEELSAFQVFMDTAANAPDMPQLTRFRLA